MSDFASAAASPPHGMVFCTTCGTRIAACAPVCIQCGAPNAAAIPPTSNKTMVTAALLCFFLGTFGIHRFYVGRMGAGLLALAIFILSFVMMAVSIKASTDTDMPGITFVMFYAAMVGLNLWGIIDLALIVIGSYRDANGLPLKR